MNKEVLDFQVNNSICEGYGCIEKATATIKVKVGHLGSISLNLCTDCVRKFDEKDKSSQSSAQTITKEMNNISRLDNINNSTVVKETQLKLNKSTQNEFQNDSHRY